MLDRILALLPVHHLAQEPEPGDGPPGPLTALLSAVARELEVLEDDVRRLQDGWFIETCEEWLVPYLADLVGLAEVPPDLGTAVSRRAFVANTVAYRRRKGTLAVLEQVTRDVTGWPTRAVEHHPLLVATVHVNHVRLDRPAVAAVRPAGFVELGSVVSPPSAKRALDPLTHTVEVRRTGSGRGRYGIGGVAVYPFSAQVQAIGAPGTGGPATGTGGPPRGPDGGWSRTRVSGGWHHVDPLGRSTPLFAPPRAESSIESLAGEADLPVPLRPRRLLELLRAARAGDLDPTALPIGVRIGTTGTDLAPERVRVCGLEDLAAGDEPQVMVDAVAGRLSAYRNGAHYVPVAVFVRYAYGSAADVGAGPYSRAERHEDLLAADPWRPPASSGETGPKDVQVAVSSSTTAPASPQMVADVAAGLAAVESAWADPASNAVGATATVSIEDSARYAGDLAVEVPSGTRLVVVAARWPVRELPDGDVEVPVPGRYTPDGLRPHVQGTLRITGGAGASVVLDGLLVEGDVVVEPGGLGSLTIAHATVTGSVRVLAAVGAANATLQVRLERAVVGAVAAAEEVPSVAVVESVLDPQALPPGTAALDAPGAHTSLAGSTVRGGLVSRSLDASSCLLDGRAEVAHRQVGCVRFSFVGSGSRTPRRFRCVTGGGGDGPPRPVYVSTDPASPAYLVLAATCSPSIRTGGERESEMGVHHHLYRPLRLRAADRQLGPYLPVGTQLGIFGS